MGRDKAGVVVGGQVLWERQLATLRECGASEVLISGRVDGPYAGAGVEIVEDAVPGLGPLGGLEAGLRRARWPLVLVLAIDLPEMTAEFLMALVRAAAEDGLGLVPGDGDELEPLAAVYPRAGHSLVVESLRMEDRSMRHFVRRAMERGLLRTVQVSEAGRGLFRNVNRPGDLEGGAR
jgi:molybdopterin-guanine dinucleotide biosynthesis protein A